MSADFEPVLVKLDWYDGPGAGITDVDGIPHYFTFVPTPGDDEYVVWPISGTALSLEREQWAIFVQWNDRHEAGDASPGHPGVNGRYDELTALLEPQRAAPADALPAHAERRWNDGDDTRYRRHGPDYQIRWRR